jgi:type IV secretion system protein VirB9
MFTLKHGIYVSLTILLVTVSYASTNSGDSQTPLGVVPKGEVAGTPQVPATDPAVTPTVPAIPGEMPQGLSDTRQTPGTTSDTETVAPAASSGSDGAEIEKPARKRASASIIAMPTQDRRVVDTAIREATRRPGNSVNSEGKTVYAYTPDGIYTLYGAPGHVIDVQLQPGEKLSGPVIAGDTVRWVVGTSISRNGAGTVTHVLVKPIQSGIETNIIITTDRRSYHLFARSLSRNFLPTVSWTYPHDEMAKLDAYNPEGQSSADMLAAGDISPDRLNFKYRIKSDDKYSWTPVRVFDDGTKTYVQMSPDMKNTEAPVLFIKGKEGLNLVNYRIKGDYYVVDRLFEEGEMRCGKDEIVRIRRGSETAGKNPWPFFGS